MAQPRPIVWCESWARNMAILLQFAMVCPQVTEFIWPISDYTLVPFVCTTGRSITIPGTLNKGRKWETI